MAGPALEATAPQDRLELNVTIPAHNEAHRLEATVSQLHDFLSRRLPVRWEMVIAENGSTDRTGELAETLAKRLPGARVLRVHAAGRGRALRWAWQGSQAGILSYMDADLAADLEAFPPLIEALRDGRYDLATGSRLLRTSQVRRGLKREVLSRGYNRLVRALLHTRFSDAQCGFKAITRPAARRLLPRVQDPGWFFDTELLVIAEKLGYRVFDQPVRWRESPDSHVRIGRTVWEDLKGLVRLRRQLGRLARLGEARSMTTE